MATLRITSRAIEALKTEARRTKKPIYAWDETQRGFGVRVSPRGAVSWQFQRWQGGVGGKLQRIAFQARDLEDAREQAHSHAVEASKGVNLPNRKREARTAKRIALSAPDVATAAARYIKRHRKPGRYWDELQKRFDRQIIPALGKDTKLHEITKADVRRLIEDKLDAGQPAGARLTYAALSPFLSWCVSQDLIATSPLAGIPSPGQSEARERTLTDAELKALWSATAKLPLYGNFYRLLLLTMQRRDEVAGITFDEIDKAAALWTIPGSRTKNGKPHLVPLSPLALAVIEDASLEADTGSPYLFPVEGRDGDWAAISSYSDAKERLDKLCTIAPWRTHDLRRTGRTNLSKLKVPREHAEKVLNHTPKDKLEGIYNLYEYLDEKRHALTVWGLHISTMVGISSYNFESSNIVPFTVKAV